jgi:hypothetical protein
MREKEVVEEAKQAGYTHVRTMAGWTKLEDWKPYGGRCRWVEFWLDVGADRIRERVAQGVQAGRDFVTGLWALSRQ